MKVYILVPKSVTPVTLDKKEITQAVAEGVNSEGKPIIVQKAIGEVTLHRYLMDYVVGEQTKPKAQGETSELKIGTGYKGNKRTKELDDAFKAAKPGDVVAIDDETIKLVQKIVEEKNWAGAGYFASQLLPFEEALMFPVKEPVAVTAPSAPALPAAQPTTAPTASA